MGAKKRKKRETYYVDPEIIRGNAAGTDKLEFALTLNQLLEDRKIDQGQLAESVGLSGSVISDYRKGKSEPRLSSIKKIANYLGIDCHYLITGVRANNQTTSEKIGLSDTSISALCNLQNRRKNNLSQRESINADILFDGIDFLLTCSNSEKIVSLIAQIIFMDDWNEKIFLETTRGNDSVYWETSAQTLSVNVALLELQNTLMRERTQAPKKYDLVNIEKQKW